MKMEATMDKLLPQALDAEQAVLGAILIDHKALDQVYSILTPDLFYSPAHKAIYQAMLDLYRANKPIDTITVCDRLEETEMLEVTGGKIGVLSLQRSVVSSANITYHALIVKEKAVQRQLIEFAGKIHENAFDPTIDLADLLDQANKGLEAVTDGVFSGFSSPSFTTLIDKALEEYIMREKAAKKGEYTGIKTPVVKLTKVLGGWQNGELTIIAGRPSMGKTAFALASIRKAAESGKHVHVFSLEMSSVRLVDRILTGFAGVDHEKYRDGYLSAEEREALMSAANDVAYLPIHIDDNPLTTLDYIRAKCRTMKNKGECDMIVIDYLQLLDNDEKRYNRNRENEVSEMSRKAKLLAIELDVPVILLSQLNRSCELRGGSKRPEISDLRESGAIEQDADTVILLYRAERYGFLVDEEGNSLKGRGELIIGKQRNGKVGTVYFGYNESLTQIYDYIAPDTSDAEVADAMVEHSEFDF